MMKVIFKIVFTTGILMWTTSSFAGVLMKEWTEDNFRYCEYSDGEVIKISFGSTCSRTN